MIIANMKKFRGDHTFKSYLPMADAMLLEKRTKLHMNMLEKRTKSQKNVLEKRTERGII